MLHIFLSQPPGDMRYGTSGTRGAGLRACAWSTTAGADVAGRRDRRIAGARRRARPRATGTSATKSRRTFPANGPIPATNTCARPTGNYRYCGRSDDMFKVSGIWVSPFEVEGGADRPSGACWRPRWSAMPRSDGLIKPRAFVVLRDEGAARRLDGGAASSTSRSAPGRGNIRAGSSSSTDCRRRRPAKSSASSCATWLSGADMTARRSTAGARGGLVGPAARCGARRWCCCMRASAASALWRDFPDALGEATGCGVFA